MHRFPGLTQKRSAARSTSNCACCKSSNGPCSAIVASASAASSAPAWRLCFGGDERAACTRCWIDSQFGRALHERGRGRNTAPRLGSPGRELQLGGDILVRARRGLRAVPRVTVGVDGGVGCLRERAVRLAPVLGATLLDRWRSARAGVGTRRAHRSPASLRPRPPPPPIRRRRVVQQRAKRAMGRRSVRRPRRATGAVMPPASS